MQNENWLFPETTLLAREAQKEMAQLISKENECEKIELILGMDVSNFLFDPSQKIYGAAVLLSFPDLGIIETQSHFMRQTFPYIPGLLGFREAPVLLKAALKLERQPDCIFVDGHGVSHPRGLGIASHIGMLLNKPTIGVAKSILVGKPKEPLKEEAGSQSDLIYKRKVVGRLLRTKKNCSPLIISIGHKVSLDFACQLVWKCLKGYRLPEPTRQAHLAANRVRKSTEP